MRVMALSAALCVAATVAVAAPKVTVKSTTFDVSGRTGAAILADLERRGPRHGFLSRAIAQTRYTMNSEAELEYRDGICRVTRPIVRLDITYVYPRLAGPASSQLKSRWSRFMSGVTRHEEMHGRIAREMAVAADRALARMRVSDGRTCARLKRDMKRVVTAIVDEHEKRQVRFDQVEHKDGGNIPLLIRRLVN